MYQGLPLFHNRHKNNADFEAEQEDKVLSEGSLHDII